MMYISMHMLAAHTNVHAHTYTYTLSLSHTHTHIHTQPRMEESPIIPSKVLHLRNLPDSVTDREVILLGLRFGKVVNVLLLKSKNQAFIEMVDANSAASMLAYYTSMPAIIR